MKRDYTTVYNNYKEGKISEDTAYLELANIIDTVVKKEFKHLPDDMKDDLQSAGAEQLIRIMRGKKIDSSSDVFNYLYTVIRNAMRKEYHVIIPEEVSTEDVKNIVHIRLESYIDVDNRLLLEHLQTDMVDDILCQVRFTGQEYQACEVILSKLMKNEPISPSLAYQYNLKDLHYFVSYVKVLRARYLNELKEEYKTSGIALIEDYTKVFQLEPQFAEEGTSE